MKDRRVVKAGADVVSVDGHRAETLRLQVGVRGRVLGVRHPRIREPGGAGGLVEDGGKIRDAFDVVAGDVADAEALRRPGVELGLVLRGGEVVARDPRIAGDQRFGAVSDGLGVEHRFGHVVHIADATGASDDREAEHTAE